jgi:hypothetical protein
MSTALASTLTTKGLTPNPSCLTVPTPYRLIRVHLHRLHLHRVRDIGMGIFMLAFIVALVFVYMTH